jgi:hypothetical protein
MIILSGHLHTILLDLGTGQTLPPGPGVLDCLGLVPGTDPRQLEGCAASWGWGGQQ